jgi:serine/threonine-protein kinase
VSPELAAVIDKALSKDHDERYQSIEEMIAALRQVMPHSGIQARVLASSSTLPDTTAPYDLPRQTLAPPSSHRLPARRTVLAVGLTLAGLAGAIYFLRPQPASPPSKIKTIAVLPFKPLLAHDRDEALELGMADTLITRLSNQRELDVRPITAVRRYAGIEQDALAAGREQRVDAVLDGQIQRAGERIRVTARVVKVADGALLWSSQFDENMTDIFAVQDSISRKVVEALAMKLAGAERERLTRRYTENTQAYQLYLLGRFHLNRLTDDGFLKSLEYFQQAIEKDPRFALAHIGVADAYNALGGFNVLRPRDVYPKARSAAESALKLDDGLAEAHTALAMVKLAHDWDWSGAEKEFKRALDINPSGSDAHNQYGFYLASMGQFDEAVSQMRRAQELDPISLVNITALGQVLYMARRYDEAMEQCRNALEMDPNLGFAHWLLGLAYMQKGMYEPAILALQKSIPLSGDSPDEPESLALAYAMSGRTGEAQKILEELKQQAKRRYTSPSMIAVLYAALGKKDQAFALLDQAYDERDNLLVLLKVEPVFDPLRSDPRFTALRRRVGLAE